MSEQQPIRNVENKGPEKDQEIAEFFRDGQSLITDYSEGLRVTFKPGNGWAVADATGEATYDPKFFIEKGFSKTQAIFTMLHEVDHVVEEAQLRKTDEGTALVEARWEKRMKQKRTAHLDNCLRDLADNRRVMDFVPAFKDETIRLYKEYAFPADDLRGKPRHIQFNEAVLRRGMLPEEQTLVDDEVEVAMQELQNIKGKKGNYDVLGKITDPNCDPVVKLKLLEKYVDPVYERLYEKDKEDKRDQNQNDKGSEENHGENGDQTDDNEFDNDYKELEKMPQGFADEQIQAMGSPSFGNDIGERQIKAYEAENNVKQDDIRKYGDDYDQIKQYIEPMREQFRRIVKDRLIPNWHLASGKDEGVMVTPGLAAVAQVSFDKGIVDAPVYSDYVGKVRKETLPTGFEISAVLDRSGSMAGEKSNEQRCAAVLVMESLREFMMQPEVRNKSLDPDLYADCEIRSFGGPKENVAIRPFSKELTDEQRVETYKALSDCSGGATEDYVSLGQIVNEMKAREATEPGYLTKVKNRKIKKLVAVFSDGASSNQAEFDKRVIELTEMGVQIVSYRKIDGVTAFVPKMADILKQGLDELCYKKP